MAHSTVIIAEKKIQAEDYSKALGGGGRLGGEGWYDSPLGAIVWLWGHVFRLEEPRDRGAEYENWQDPSLWPCLIENPRLLPSDDPKCKAQIRVLKSLLPKARRIIIATDPDREGETIGWETLDAVLGIERLFDSRNAPELLRLVCGDPNLAAIRKAFDRLEKAERYYPRYMAGRTRAIVDNWSGINATVAASVYLRPPTLKGAWKTGRVKGPATWIVVARDRELADFKEQKYYEIEARVETGAGALTLRHAPPPEARIMDRAEAQRIADQAGGYSGQLRVEQKQAKVAPPKLFTKNQFLIAAGRKLGFPTSKSEKILQELYQTHRAVTYPRSACPFISSEDVANLPRILDSLQAVDAFRAIIPSMLAPDARERGALVIRQGSVVNDKKVADASHTAIIPTGKVDLAKMSPDERAVFELIATRYLVNFLPDAVDLRTTITMTIHDRPYTARGSVEQSPGWRVLGSSTEDAEDDEAKNRLPPVRNGDAGRVAGTGVVEKKTTPPPRYTEITLLEAMEKAHQFVEDKRLQEVLKNTAGKGIGTEATRKAIVEELIKSRQIEEIPGGKKGAKPLRASAEGHALISALERSAADLPRVETTALLELQLDRIESARSREEAESLAADVLRKARETVEAQFASIKASRPAEIDPASLPPVKPSSKQLKWAEDLARRRKETLPRDVRGDARKLAEWIDARKPERTPGEEADRAIAGAGRPATEPQRAFVRRIRDSLSLALSDEEIEAMDMRAASRFIEEHRSRMPAAGQAASRRTRTTRPGAARRRARR